MDSEKWLGLAGFFIDSFFSMYLVGYTADGPASCWGPRVSFKELAGIQVRYDWDPTCTSSIALIVQLFGFGVIE